MDNLKIAVIILLSLTEVIILINALKSRKPFATLLLNALIGIAAIICINLTSGYTGAFIPVNRFTVGGGAAFGLPAVCGFLLCKFLFI